MSEPAALAVKETRPPFLRLSARLGWPLGPVPSRPGVPLIDRPLTLGIAGRRAIPLAEPFGTFGGRTLPKGLAIAADGRMFLADPLRRVILTAQAGAIPADRSAEANPLWPFVPLWPARPLPAPATPGGLCDLAGAGAAEDLYALVEPVGVAIAPSGDLAILDRGARRVLVLAWPHARLRRLIRLEDGTPEALAFDGAGRLYVALTGPGAIRRWDALGRPDPAFPRIAPRQPLALAVAGRDGACGCRGGCDNSCTPILPPGPVLHVIDGGRLLSLDDRGLAVATDEDALRLTLPPLLRGQGGDLTWSDPAAPARDPVLFRNLALDVTGRHRGSGRPLIALPRRIEVPRAGAFTTTALDSGVSSFHWDRVTFDLDLPDSARLVVSTLTSEVEVAFDQLPTVSDDRWSGPLALVPGDLPEVMVQSGPGRFLWLKVELSGDGTTAPLIRGIDIFAPRRSALRYLPAPFHDDPESARFLDRFLGYFDTVSAEITARHRGLAELFDPRVTPSEFLSWLGAWFDMTFLAAWPEATRREMIAQAMDLFRQRGTVAGLKRILQWHTGLADPLPQVIEHFRLPAGGVMIGGAPLDPDAPAHRFTIVLPAHLAASDEDRLVLERLIAASVPAHARFDLRLIHPGITLGCHATIGVDTILGPAGGGALGTGDLGGTLATGAAVPDALIRFPQLLTAGPGEGALSC